MAIATESRITADGLASRIGGTRAEDIRRTIAGLIETGELAPGTRLPTIREVAAALSTSVGSVADAWAELRRIGLLDTRRRGGTTVAETPPHRAAALRAPALDLSKSPADPDFLPELSAPLLSALAETPPTRGDAITGSLRAAVLPRLPFTAEAIVAAPGTHSAMHLAFGALAEPGDTIAVEDPTCIRNLGLLTGLGVRVVSIASDQEGPLPESVAAALAQRPSVLAFQPVAAVPIGSALSRRRRDELARLISGAEAPPWILEEDPAGPLATDSESLGAILPERVVRVVHFARAYGGLLQTAVLAGAAPAIAAIESRQRRDGARPNPLLENVLARLLADPAADRLVADAAAAYRRRNAALIDALGVRGIRAQGAGGFFAWIPVVDEHDALLSLAQRGISASPGSRSGFGAAGPHLRLSTMRIPDDDAAIAELADAVAAAAARTFAAEDE